MRILHLSDTHGRHAELTGLPEADVVVHSGDFTRNGGEAEMYDFISWFSGLPYAHKIFIAGNHDLCLYGKERIDGLPEGVPLFVEEQESGKYAEAIARIPEHTEVLITHEPPYSLCDRADYGQGVSPEAIRYSMNGYGRSVRGCICSVMNTMRTV